MKISRMIGNVIASGFLWIEEKKAERKELKEDKQREHRRWEEFANKVDVGEKSISLKPEAIREVMQRHYDQEDQARSEVESQMMLVDKPGILSENVDWMFIQEAGQYLSPVGSDSKHTVTLTERRRHTGNVVIAKFECTNTIYSEWVKCCCDTMWHTKNKILEDIHGNKYPVGKLCEVTCTIRY